MATDKKRHKNKANNNYFPFVCNKMFRKDPISLYSHRLADKIMFPGVPVFSVCIALSVMIFCHAEVS